jgi:hypothetical protein
VYRSFLDAVGDPEARRHKAERAISDQALGEAAA